MSTKVGRVSTCSAWEAEHVRRWEGRTGGARRARANGRAAPGTASGQRADEPGRGEPEKQRQQPQLED